MLYENVKMTVTGSPGTGTATLNAAVAGSRSFADASVPTGSIVSYLIEEGTNKEEGRGTYTVSGTTLSRDTVVASTNGGSKVSFGSGAIVSITPNNTDLFSMADSGSFIRNKIHNGDMRIDQRRCGTSLTLAAAGLYSADRWWCNEDTDGSATIQQQTTVVPPGFTHALKFAVTSADSSLTTTQSSCLSQMIEGYDLSEFNFGTANARPFTLSFWVRSSVTGTYGVALQNGAFDRNYTTYFTINQANTWEYKTLTVPGDTTGTWYNDNRGGLNVNFTLGTGPTYRTTTLNAWEAGAFFGRSSDVNLMATNGATFYLTGVQLEMGSVVTPFERRPFGMELEICKRYFYKTFPYGAVPGANVDHEAEAFSVYVPFSAGSGQDYATINICFPTRMRVQPLITFYNAFNGTEGQCRTQNGNQNFSAGVLSWYDMSITPCVNGANLNDGEVVLFHLAANAEW